MSLTRKTYAAVVAVLATLAVVLVLLFVPTNSAGAIDEPCVPSPAVAAHYTDWVNSGEPVRTEENAAPEADTDLSRWVAAGEDTDTITEAVIGVDQWWHWNGGNEGVAPAWPGEGWNTDNGDHNGLKNKDDYAPNTVFDASVKGGDNASWFYHEFRESADAVTDTDYFWQKQVRTFVPAVPEVVCETPSETPTVPTETTTVTPPVVTETVTPPVVTETSSTTVTETETVTATPVPEEDETPVAVPEKEDEPKPEDKPQPVVLTTIECVDGVNVTTVTKNGNVVSVHETGSCDRTEVLTIPGYVKEEGL